MLNLTPNQVTTKRSSSQCILIPGTLLGHILHLMWKSQLQIHPNLIPPTLKAWDDQPVNLKQKQTSHISHICQNLCGHSKILLVFDRCIPSFQINYPASGALPSARAAARTISQTWTRSSGAKRFGTSPVFLEGGGGGAWVVFCKQKMGVKVYDGKWKIFSNESKAI